MKGAQKYRHANQPLLRRRVMRSGINLLPHSQIIVGTPVKFWLKRNSCNPVKHQVGELRNAK